MCWPIVPLHGRPYLEYKNPAGFSPSKYELKPVSDEISDTDLDWYVTSPFATVAAIAEELRRRRREARTAMSLI
jgi:hypothetical protein